MILGPRALATGLWVGAAALAVGRAEAADDGAFGRLEGDLELDVGVGPVFAADGAQLGAQVGAFYLATAGVYGTYADSLGSDSAKVARSFGVGAALRPLFLGRYAKNLETGAPRWELFVDSLELGVGTFWYVERAKGSIESPGLELALALAVPFLEDASGPHVGIRGALRWRSIDLEGRSTGDLIDRGAFVTLTLAWHQLVTTHLVDAFDERPE